jgi:hypothetical protein
MAATLARALTALRQPRRAVRIAQCLWAAWAVIVWNVVFDHVIVVAGRDYLAAAGAAALNGPYPSMDHWMRPAVTHGLWMASASAACILVAGFIGFTFAER